MGKRAYLIFFLALPASAAMTSSQSTLIPPVKVTAAKKAVRSLTSGPKTIITQDEIHTTGVTTLAQTLQDLGGVQLQNTTGNGSQVLLSMRGFGTNASSNTLLLINGIPITNPDMAPPDLNAIPINEIEYIEITAGSESVLYGDQAVGGAINIITRDKIKEKFALSCNIGSYNQRNCYFALHHQYRQLTYRFTVASNHTNNYRQHNDDEKNILLGRLDYPYATGRVSLDYQLTHENMQYPGALTLQQVKQNRRQASNATDFFADTNGFLHLYQQQQLTSLWQLKNDIVWRKMTGHGVLTTPFTQTRTIYFLKPQLQGYWHQTKLMSGLDLQHDDYLLNSSFGINNNTQQKYGLFALANIPLASQLNVSIGARGAQQNNRLQSINITNNINRALATTLGLTFTSSSQLHFYLRQAGSFRFPKADETASAPTGITSLRTQRGLAYETGAEWQQQKYSAKIGLYQLKLRDEIAFDPTQTPTEPFGSNRNLSPTERHGLMLSGHYKVTHTIMLGGQYQYVNARFQNGINAGKRIPLVAENIIHAGVDYRLKPHWTLYTEALYTGNQYAANDDANIAGKIGGYTVYNLHLRYRYKQFSASLRANNIFNKYYYFYTVYQPSIPGEYFYPAPGRNIVLTVNYSFN